MLLVRVLTHRLFLAALLLTSALGAGAEPVAQAIWCSGNTTLYLTYSETQYSTDGPNNTYNNEPITQVWSGADKVIPSGHQPDWSYYNTSVTSVTRVVIDASFAELRPKTCTYWFYNFLNLNTIVGLKNLNTSEVTSMDNMFANCGKLTALDLSNFNTSNVTNMGGMFYFCEGLTSLDLSSFDTSKVDNMENMFAGCSALQTLTIGSGWNTYNVTSSNDMYDGCNSNLVYPVCLFDNDGKDLNRWAISNNISTTDNTKTVNVVLQGRTLYKDGDWNTICLPFSTPIDGTPLAGATLRELDASTSSLDADGKLKLTFTNVDPKNIVAGKPYLIKWAKVSGGDIVSPVFNGVTITSTTTTAVEFTNGKNATAPCKFVGQYGLFDITSANMNTIVMLGSNNMIGYSTVERSLRSMRAHFEIPLATGQSAPAMTDYEIDFDGEATGVISTTYFTNFTNSDDSWYTLDGRCISVSSDASVPSVLPKGIYIHKGRKIFVK